MIDRNKTPLLGLQMSDVGAALASMLGGGYVNYFSLDQPLVPGDPAGHSRSRASTPIS